MIQLFRCDEDTVALAAERGLLNSSLLSCEMIVSYDHTPKKKWHLQGRSCSRFSGSPDESGGQSADSSWDGPGVGGVGCRWVWEELRVEVQHPQPASAEALNWLPQRRVRDPHATIISIIRAAYCSSTIRTDTLLQPCFCVRLWKRKWSKLFQFLQQSPLRETNES